MRSCFSNENGSNIDFFEMGWGERGNNPVEKKRQSTKCSLQAGYHRHGQRTAPIPWIGTDTVSTATEYATRHPNTECVDGLPTEGSDSVGPFKCFGPSRHHKQSQLDGYLGGRLSESGHSPLVSPQATEAGSRLQELYENSARWLLQKGKMPGGRCWGSLCVRWV